MSTYVLSDVHGNIKAFKEMLNLIKFSDKDHLYIIGDIIDRGEDPIGMIDLIRSYNNITTTLGNHEHMMSMYYKTKDINDQLIWYQNGGKATDLPFRKLSQNKRKEILEWIDNLDTTITINIENQKYVLGHACPWADNSEDIVWKRIYPTYKSPDLNTIYISGHTPTIRFDQDEGIYDVPGRMKKNKDKHIWFIDCGCGFPIDERSYLCCLRLEDKTEFYIKA